MERCDACLYDDRRLRLGFELNFRCGLGRVSMLNMPLVVGCSWCRNAKACLANPLRPMLRQSVIVELKPQVEGTPCSEGGPQPTHVISCGIHGGQLTHLRGSRIACGKIHEEPLASPQGFTSCCNYLTMQHAVLIYPTMSHV